MTSSTFRCLALEMIFEGTNICVNLAHHPCVSLIMTNGPGTHTRSPPEVHHIFPSLFSLALGSTMAGIWPSSLLYSSSLCWFDFLQQHSTENGKKWSNGDEKLQVIYRWKALTEENPLKQLILKMEHCTSLAFKEKEDRCRIQSGDLRSN
jgi:hypothetical protein